MNGSKIVAGSAKSRRTRTIKVAPVTRAVRAALAISVTAMALTGSGMAFAGTCTPPSSNTIHCDGSFLNTITFPDVDLTLVVGANAPTSVTPGLGMVGIEADWVGNVNVTNYADITTSGADGIHAYGSTSAQIVNHGTVVTTANSSSPVAIAIDTVANGNIHVVNTGYVGSFATGVYDVTAVFAESTEDVYSSTSSVYNQSAGAIFAFTDGNGAALGIEDYSAHGDVSVTNNGLLVAVSYYGLADGVFAAGQSADVSNGGDLYSIGYSWAAGIEAQGSDLTTVNNNSGLIYAAAAGAYGHAFGVYATSGAGGTTVYNTGDIDVLGPYATGIQAQSNGGDVNVRNNYGGNMVVGNSFTSYYATGISASSSYDNSNISVYNGGGITALSHYGSTGIAAVATGAGSTVDVINSGSLYVNTSGKYTSTGIVASGDGLSEIDNHGVVTVAYGGTSYGLMALSFNDLAVVNNTGKVDVTAANYVGNGFGLVVSSANGVARAYNSGTVTVNAGYVGIGIEATGMTGTRVGNSGSVAVDARYAYGIVATSGQGYVNVYNGASGLVNATSAVGTAYGIVGVSTQSYVSLANGGTVSATGLLQATGMFARADAGNASVGNNGNLYANSYLGSAIGVLAIASGGNASVFANDRSNVQVYSSGNTAIGIEAQADDGAAAVYNLGNITATAGQDATAMYYSGALGIADGIFAAGQIASVSSAGRITAIGYGWAAGIEAQGSNAASVSNDGSINATSTGDYSHAFGVYATGGASGVTVFNSGTINVQGSYATGIEAQAQGGGINVTNSGDIIVGNTNRTYYATGINAATNYAASNIYVRNYGSVTALSNFGSTGIAAVATGSGSTAGVRSFGDVYVTTASKYGNASMGIIASGDGNASINNGGRLTVAYGGNSYGAVALSVNGDAGVTNTGGINVTAAKYVGSGYGIIASSVNGTAHVGNFDTGAVSVDAGYYGFGIRASGMAGSTVYNFGAVDVQAKYGYGILATSGQGNVSILNIGTGSVTVNSPYATALGIAGIATLGDVLTYNSGTVSVTGFDSATGIFARADAGDATAVNRGDISATSAIGLATGMLAHATGGNARAYNTYGDITAISLGNDAIGIETLSDDGVAIANNTGTITVTGGANAYAIQYTGALGLADGIFAAGDSVYARSGGGIYATGYGWAAGIEAQGNDLTRVYNTGTIVATSTGDFSHAFGVYATSGAGGLTVYNGGDITAMGPYATGVQAQSSGVIAIDNRGDIAVGDAYNSYYATGINAATNYAGANIFVGNSGSISTNSYFGSTGVAAVAIGAGSTGYVSNSGDIYVNTTGKYNSTGIVVSSDGDARIRNTGSVTVAYGGYSYGAVALSFNGIANVQNDGNVDVTGAGLIGFGYGIISSSANLAASVNNTGSVTVYAGYAAMGIRAMGLTGTSVGNSGTVAVDTLKYGYGILATSGRGDVSIYNSTTGVVDVYSYAGSALGITGIATLGDVRIYSHGSVSVSGYLDAIGILAIADAGNVTVTNSGDITAFTYVSPAIGVLAQATARDASVSNVGSISATSVGDAAIGIQGEAYNDVSISNSGFITVTGGANAYAVQYTGSLGLADGIFGSGRTVRVNNNGGSIYATGYGWAAGIEAQGSDLTSVYSSGSIAATSVGDYSHAFGIYATSGAGGLTVHNYGNIGVQGPYAAGIQAQSSGAINISNSGNITAGGAYTSYYATGINAATSYAASDIFIRNDGGVTANSYFGSTGIAAVATGPGSNGTVVNSGDVYVNTAGKYGSLGIVVSADGNANIYSTGSVTVAYGGTSYGALALAFNGNATVSNLGDVNVTAAGIIGYGFGLVSSSANAAASVLNTGSVSVYAGYLAMGIQASSLTGTSVTNSGSVAVDTSKYGYGILATSGTGNVSIGNSNAGSVDVNSYAGSALGIAGIATLGDVSVYNAGTVSVQSSDVFGSTEVIGIFARASDGNVVVNSPGDVFGLTYGGSAIGVLAQATGGDARVYNAGSISEHTAGGSAIGIEGQSDTGAVSVSNSGDIAAIVGLPVFPFGNIGDADGILALAKTVDIDNSGSIAASGDLAFGIRAQADDLALVSNSGAITAAGQDYAFGVYAATGYLAGGASEVIVDNSGSISSTAFSNSTGIRAQAQGVPCYLAVSNSGSIVSYSSNGSATGVYGYSEGAVTLSNSGSILGQSANGNAVGVFGYSDIKATIANSGEISASSDSAGGSAYGVIAGGIVADVSNSGTITATGSYAAVGALVQGSEVYLSNSGAISAVSTGANGATGVVAQSWLATVNNSGSISATDAAYAVAVRLNAGVASTLTNTGTITTYAPLEGNIAVLGSNGVENILNYGYIHGAIVTNGGVDQLFNGNGGLWLVDNHSTDFGDGDDIIGNAAGGTIQLADGAIYLGDGDDTINNGGTIQLTDSAIYFGGGAGNAFTNNGIIQAFGNSLIDMGSGGAPSTDSFAPTLIPSLNATPLVNNGVISFLDGAADDVLTIVGDLGGDGAINIDVSLLNSTSDMLYVDGSIANGSTQTVNMVLDQLPTSATTLIPFAHVTGNSVDGSFVAGTFSAGNIINYDPSNFLDLQLGVVSQIDPTNATDDVFSIGLDVAGLNDTGTLAANLASGVQSLVNSQIGTWRQRMGVLPQKGANDAGLSPWFRVFSDKGEIDPAHVAANFGQGGNFRFDQSNTGQEVGMNVSPGERFNFGLLLNKSEGSQHLVAPGVGSDRIKTNAVGIYGTWISPKGYYVDASYRWIDFDARLQSAGGEQGAKGNASAWNLEAGYDAWTLPDDLKITPQIQYTRTQVDVDPVAGAGATFAVNGGDSSRARLGVALSKSINSDSGITWTPYGSVNAVREFNGKTDYAINNTFFGSTNIEGTSAMLELGLGMQKGGWSVTGGVNWTDGGALKSFTGGQLELRYSW